MDSYLSIITNFGCHYTCPYCIVKENGIQVAKTTLEGLDNLDVAIKFGGFNIVSVSGGGDPLHNFKDTYNTKWYGRLFNILENNNIPLEMHTSYINSIFPYNKCKRVVYHVRTTDLNELMKITRRGNEIVRIVMIATENLTVEDLIKVSRFVEMSPDIDELSFRQLVNNKYETEYFNHEVLLWGHKHGLWHYIEQNDYNTYYVEGKVYKKYSEIGK